MKLRIFVIDDEECIRDTFRWYLEDQGHEVITAESPKTIINFSNNCNRRKHACGDVFFVDHNMPEMTGMTFLEHAFPVKVVGQVGIGLGANYPHLYALLGASTATMWGHWSSLYQQLMNFYQE